MLASAGCLLLASGGSAHAQGSVAGDKAALEALYDNTAGASWTLNYGWKTTEPLGSWDGVTTNSDGRVTGLSLDTNGLNGSLPSALGDLTELESLFIVFNEDLTGSIPGELGDLTKLESLELFGNGLTGSIPGDLGDLSELVTLDVSTNDLSGSIPSELGNLSNLESLYVGYNEDLDGSIPGELGNLTSLVRFGAESSGLTGSIPSELGSLTALQSLWLHETSLSGSIPAELGGMAALKALHLNDNSLTGTIPAELGDLASLTRLELQNNMLSGAIPAELGELAELRYLLLENNMLSGALPAELANLLKIRQVKVHDNTGLTGEIPFTMQNTELMTLIVGNTGLCAPPSLHTHWDANLNYDGVACPEPDREFLEAFYDDLGGGSWTDSTNWKDDTKEVGEWYGVVTNADGRVTGLSLPGNGLTGTIPANLDDLLWLQTLDLSGNGNLTGEFPDALAGLVNLQEVNLSDTGLEGEISPGFTEASSLSALNVSGAMLCLPPDRDFQDWLDANPVAYTGDRCEPTDRTTLVAFYYATDGPNWHQSVNWLSGEPLELWQGVSTTNDRVTLLDLPDRGLTGRIPPETGDLEFLEFLSLLNNPGLTGPLPRQLGQLTNLQTLVVRSTGLTGPIPTILRNLPITVLEVEDTNLCVPRSTAFRTWLEGVINPPGSPLPRTCSSGGGGGGGGSGGGGGGGPSLSFESSSYSFELPENRDGRVTPVPIGRVRAEGPSGLIHELVNDADGRFAIDPGNGRLTYVGSGEDFETGPTRFELTVRVRSGDTTAEADVEILVTDENDPPTLVEDRVTTPEDTPVVIPVLANDSDQEGETLRLLAVSAARHGAAGLGADGTVRYVPEPNYHGPDRFSYQAEDEAGQTATGAVVITVTPVNDPPETIGTIPDQALRVGEDPTTLHLPDFFRDADGETLEFIVATAGGVVTASVSSSVLSLVGLAEGAAGVTVTAFDQARRTAALSFAVAVEDPLAEQLFEDSLAAIGRGHLASLRATISRRTQTGGVRRNRLRIGGQEVPLGLGEALDRGRSRLAGWITGFGRDRTDRFGAAASPGSGWLEAAGSQRRPRHGGFFTRPTPDRAGSFLRGSDFLVGFGNQAPGDEGGERRFTVWGQGDVQTFRGTTSGSYDGDVRTAYLGLDVRITNNLLAGLAASHSMAASNWSHAFASGRLNTTLQAAHPYLRWQKGRSSVSAILGAGWGNVENTTGDREQSNDLSLAMGVLEVRQLLTGASGGLRLGLRGDASWARLDTGSGESALDGLSVPVHQVRLGLEMSGGLSSGLTPFAEAHVRRDGGDGQTGTGVEVAGGLRAAGRLFSQPLLLEARGRLLALHEQEEYEERGFSLLVQIGQGSERPGLQVRLTPRLGAGDRATDALWMNNPFESAARGSPHSRALDAEVAYGLRLPGGRLLTPYGLYRDVRTTRHLRAGARLGPAGGDFRTRFRVEFFGERRSSLLGSPDNRFSVVATFPIGSDGARQPRRVSLPPSRRAAVH